MANRKLYFLKAIIGSAAYFKLEEFDKAVSDGDSAIQKSADFPKGYFRKASALRQMDRVEEALALIQSAPEKVREDANVKQLLTELQQDFKEDNFLPKGISQKSKYL